MAEGILKSITEYIKEHVMATQIAVYIAAVATAYYLVRGNIHSGEENTLVVDVESDKSDEIKEDKTIYVSISGAVMTPGVFTLPVNARMVDLFYNAGGLSSLADPLWMEKNINLSQKLTDSQKIYIPYKWELSDEEIARQPKELISLLAETKNAPNSGVEPDKETGSEVIEENKVNVNQADQELLESLSGIGPSYAQKIINGRPYSDFDDLLSNSGVPKATLLKLQDQLGF